MSDRQSSPPSLSAVPNPALVVLKATDAEAEGE
jgi:hypothetical protein